MTAGSILSAARPLQSPRLTALKRPAELDLSKLDLPLAKCMKLEGSLARASEECTPILATPTPLEEPLEDVVDVHTESPERTPQKPRDSFKDTMTPECPVKSRATLTIGDAVEAAIGLYKELWTVKALEVECGPAADDAREGRADAACEQWAEENYESMRDAVAALLPWVGDLAPAADGSDYDVLCFQGKKPPPRLSWRQNPKDDECEIVMKQLKQFRGASAQNRARDALITLCAAMGCRREKCWVELYDNEMKDEIRKLGLRRTKSQKMKTLAKEFVADLVGKEEWCCQFARALVMPESFIRMSFARGVARPLPASLVVAYRMPLWDVFYKMDEEIPVRGEAKCKEWWMQPGRQFAFQEANLDEKEGSRKERQPVSSLKPDPRLRDLVRSKKPVVYLDMLAALATRDLSKEYCLSNIVKAELATVFREAKARGEAVVFILGSDDPRKLAQRVYLRPPLCDFGLRCGFFRWRASADVPWAREQGAEDRSTFMLQMP